MGRSRQPKPLEEPDALPSTTPPSPRRKGSPSLAVQPTYRLDSSAAGPPGHPNRNPSEINNLACHPYRVGCSSLGGGGRPLPSPPLRVALLSPHAPCTAGRAQRPGFPELGRRGARGWGGGCGALGAEGKAPHQD